MKLGIIGYGRMGKLIEQLAKSRGHEIISIIDVDNTLCMNDIRHSFSET